ncbi:MAG: TonB-dependent receptor [bacterium]
MNKFSFILLVVFLLEGAAAAKQPDDLGTIVVSATRTEQKKEDLATNVTVITQEDLIKIQPATVTEALQNLSFINAGNNGHIGALSTLTLRGSTASQVLMLIDGRAVNDLSFGNGIPNQIPINNVERIEIIRGGGSVLYGANAMGGIINIVTKTASSIEPSVDFGFEYQRYESMKYKLNFEIKRGPADAFVSLSRQLSTGYRQNEDFLGEDIFFKFGYDLRAFGKVSFNGSFYTNDLGIPGPNYTPVSEWGDDKELSASTPNDSQDNENRYGIVEHTIVPSENFRIKTRLYGNENERIDKYPDANFNMLSQNMTKGIELQSEAPFGFLFGFDIRQDRFFQKLKLSNNMLENRRYTNRAFFLQQELHLADGLTLIPGVRLENHSEYSNQTNPKLTLIYKANSKLKLSANGGRAFRAPTFNDLIYNPNIEPETAYSYDAGVEVSLMENILFNTTLYRIDYDDLIDWTPDSTGMIWTPNNVQGKVRSDGVETMLTHNISKYFDHNINYTYNSTRNRETDKILHYHPANKVNYTFTAKNSNGAALDITVVGVGKQFTDNTMTNSIPGYGILNIQLRQNIHSALVYLGYNNSGNKRYLNRFGYPIAGMTYYAGISFNFIN